MSIESAKLFKRKMETNLEFCNKVMEIKIDKEFQAFRIKEGFDFTGIELKAANEELTDEDLDKVVGGKTNNFQQCTPDSTAFYCRHN